MPTALENLCNRINDWDLTWVGFRALRPAPAENMTARVIAILCLVYCPLAALITFAISFAVLHNATRRAPEAVPWIVAGAAAVLFLLMQSLLAHAWNCRARRLRAAQPSSNS